MEAQENVPAPLWTPCTLGWHLRLQVMQPGKVQAGGLSGHLLLIWSIRLCRIEFDFFPSPHFFSS